MAQKNSHVPKFGNWDNDNVPYTTFFENARKEKTGVRMNPNDPEENPEAFMWGTVAAVGLETDGDIQPVRVDSHKSNSAEKTHIEEHMGHNPPQGRKNFDPQKSRSRKSTTSEFRCDKSNSDQSLPQSGLRRRLKPDRKKGSANERSNSFSPSGHSRQRSGNYPSDESQHHRAASIPKFGAWDETDPTSGEGFTVIFNKVKEEKQIASTQFPVAPEQTNTYSGGQASNEGSSFTSKVCCCLFSRGRE